jgi:dTDP-4-amino-4,6-dideoxygalactose transaminase
MPEKITIDFNKPEIMGREIEYIREAFTRSHISGDGFFTKKCQTILQNELSTPKAVLTTSCTHALEMAAILLEIQAGDEVIFPSFTFVSTVNAFVLRGARPVFVDIRPDTLNIDENLIEEKISVKTRAIVVVHYAGVGCEMDTICGIAQKFNIPVVEDNAHGLFGKYKGQYLGTMGCMATQSFHETKNISCGEGGAILINDPKFIERAEIIREKGTNRSRFFRGQVDKYTWVDIGSSYLPSDILAAVLCAQLENWKEIQEKRRQIWEAYYDGLAQWASEEGVQLPFIPPECDQAYHMFYLVLPTLASRQRLMRDLKQSGIVSVFHYLPLHLSEMGQKFGGKCGDCRVSEKMGDCLLRLPFYNTLLHEEVLTVVSNLKKFKVN